MSVTVKKTGMGLESLRKRLEQVRNQDVLVGIPQEKTKRKDDSILTNAELLYIHTKGSPINNLPPRPVLQPAIKANKDLITPHLHDAAKAILQQDPGTASEELQKAGTAAANAAKRFFIDSKNGWKPLAESTLEAKRRKYGEDHIPTILIDTGQMRRAITWVVRDKNQIKSTATTVTEKVAE